MTTKKLLAVAGLVAFAALSLNIPKVFAQSPPPGVQNDDNDNSLQMVVNYGQDQEKRRHSHRGMMEPLGMPFNQAVAITLQFPNTAVGQSVIVSPLDGGAISAQGPLSVSADGIVTFNFQADGTPGLYRLLVQLSTATYQLQLYAIDPNRPSNPPGGPGSP